MFVQVILHQQWRRFAMSKIARRRADKFGDLVRMLELGAINLDDCVAGAQKNFCSSLYYVAFTRTCRTKEQHCPYGFGRIIQSGLKYLVKRSQFANRTLRPDDPGAQL